MQRELEAFLRAASNFSPAANALEQQFKLRLEGRSHLTLKEIAAQTGYSYGYVRRRHAAFRRTVVPWNR